MTSSKDRKPLSKKSKPGLNVVNDCEWVFVSEASDSSKHGLPIFSWAGRELSVTATKGCDLYHRSKYASPSCKSKWSHFASRVGARKAHFCCYREDVRQASFFIVSCKFSLLVIHTGPSFGLQIFCLLLPSHNVCATPQLPALDTQCASKKLLLSVNAVGLSPRVWKSTRSSTSGSWIPPLMSCGRIRLTSKNQSLTWLRHLDRFGLKSLRLPSYSTFNN